MNPTLFEQRRKIESLSAEDLAKFQLERLNRLLVEVVEKNRFYAEKYAGLALPLQDLEQLHELAYTYKDELVPPGSDDLAANLTYPIERYVRYHQTSGTRGRPMVVLDTEEDWAWWMETWQYVLDAAELNESDRVMMAFSFGPFIGFWSAHDAVVSRGCLAIPSGGFSTLNRLALMRTSQATVVFCTPSYALHMAEVAAENNIDIGSLPVRKIIVAGEPGGSAASTRGRIETAWNAEVLDHAGASEVGPWGYADNERRGLHVVESSFVAEFLSIDSGQAAGEGELAELVLTSLGRFGCPVIRYRTGDLVRPTWNDGGDNNFVLLEGGVIGRVDDMMIIRGVNVFPSSIEQILHSFPEIVEYRLTAHKSGEMDALTIEIEDRLNDPVRVQKELQIRLGLRVAVETVALGELPRFAGKGRRFIDMREG